MTTSIAAGSSASFGMDAWATLTLVVSSKATIALTSLAPNLLSSSTVSQAQSKTYGPFGVPMTVVVTAVDQGVTYDVTGNPIVNGALVDAAGGVLTYNVPTSIASSTTPAAELSTFLNSLPEGSCVTFPAGAIFNLESGISVNQALKINGNGSRLRPSAAALSVAGASLQFTKTARTYSSLSFAVAVDALTLTLPSGVVANVGETIRLESNTVYVTGYNFGLLATVLTVSGQVITFSTPSPADFTCNTVVMRPPCNDVVIENLILDHTAYPNVIDATHGLLITGNNATFRKVQAYGNEYAMLALTFRGEGCLVDDCYVDTFLNTQGIVDGGRLGYGFTAFGNFCNITNSTFIDCKHATVGGAARAHFLRGYSVKNCTVRETLGWPHTAFTGSLDCHANLSDTPEYVGNTIFARAEPFTVRSGKAFVSRNIIEQVGAGSGVAAAAIRITEADVTSLIIKDNSFDLFAGTTSTGSLFISTPVVNLRNVLIENNTLINSTLFHSIGSTLAIENITIRGNRSIDCGGCVILHSAPSAVVNNINITDNVIETHVTNSSESVITFRPTVIGAANTSTVNGLNIHGNWLRQNNSSTNHPITIGRGLVINNLRITDNDCQRTNVADSAGGYGIYIFDAVLTNGLIAENVCLGPDEVAGYFGQIIITAANNQNTILTNLAVRHNRAHVFAMSEAASSFYVINSMVVEDNHFERASSNRPVSLSAVASSSGWTNSTGVLLFRRNRVWNGSATGSVLINANCVNNRFVFENNDLYGPIEELSNTHFRVPIGHSQVTNSGRPQWKGGTTARTDGSLISAAAPTTAAWIVGEIVHQSAPAASGFIGWVCTTAGTPGTWKTFGAVSA